MWVEWNNQLTVDGNGVNDHDCCCSNDLKCERIVCKPKQRQWCKGFFFASSTHVSKDNVTFFGGGICNKWWEKVHILRGWRVLTCG